MTTTVYTPTTAPPPGGRARRFGLRGLVAASALVGALLLVSGYVFAQLNATATATNNATAGTLSLTMAANGAGFTTDFGDLGSPSDIYIAPGDKFIRSVNLTNGGTLAAINLKLSVTTPASNYLVDSTHGLKVTVDSCPSAWALSGSPGSWGCSVTPTNVLAATPISTLITTPQTLTGLSSLSVGQVVYLRFTIELPNQTETTTNGVTPNPGIQGATAALTWKFTEDQRAARTVEA